MRNSGAKFPCEPRWSELILACLAKNAANRNFSNFAFNAVKYLAWLAMRNSHPKNGHNHARLYEPYATYVTTRPIVPSAQESIDKMLSHQSVLARFNKTNRFSDVQKMLFCCFE